MSAHRTEIGGFAYTLEALPEGERALVLEQLLRVPAIATVIAKPPEARTLADAGALLDGFVAHASELAELGRLFLRRSTCNGAKVHGVDFMARKGAQDALHWLLWCIRVTFGSLDEVLVELGEARTVAARPVRADLLANVERDPIEQPTPAPEPRSDAHAGYWLGSAGGEVAHWRERALAAESALAELRAREEAFLRAIGRARRGSAVAT